MSLHKAQVCAHAVATGEEHHVVDDQVDRVDNLTPAVATNGNLHRQQAAQPCSGALGAILLGEGEESVEHDHDADRDSQDRHAGDECKDGGRPQHQGEEVSHLRDQQTHR